MCPCDFWHSFFGIGRCAHLVSFFSLLSNGMANPRHRSWVFTLNNPTVLDDTYAVPGQKFLCWQVEKGASGTVHIQGVVTFTAGVSAATARTRILGAHAEYMKGTLVQAVHYCEKPVAGCSLGDNKPCLHCKKPKCLVSTFGGNCHHCATALLLPNGGRVAGPFMYGDRPKGPGARTDIENVMQMTRDGTSEREIAEAHPGTYLRYYRALDRYRGLCATPRSEQTFSVALWGPPGSGKSRRVAALSGTQYWVAGPRSSTGGVWWDNYSDQSIVVFDEFAGWISLTLAKRLCDRYPLRLETKGGGVEFCALKIYFTSNRHPSRWWKSGLGAMARRLEGDCGKIEYVGGTYEGVDYPSADSWRNSEAYAAFCPGYDSNYPAVSANLQRPY